MGPTDTFALGRKVIMAIRVFVKKNGKPDMRFAANRMRFLKDPTENLDGSADVRLAINKDKVATKREAEKSIKPNASEDYFQLQLN